jgi:hypothetical protein
MFTYTERPSTGKIFGLRFPERKTQQRSNRFCCAPSPIQRVPGELSPKIKSEGSEIGQSLPYSTHIHKGGLLPPLPHTPLCHSPYLIKYAGKFTGYSYHYRPELKFLEQQIELQWLTCRMSFQSQSLHCLRLRRGSEERHNKSRGWLFELHCTREGWWHNHVEWWGLALPKGPNMIGVSLPSLEDRNRANFWKHCVF